MISQKKDLDHQSTLQIGFKKQKKELGLEYQLLPNLDTISGQLFVWKCDRIDNTRKEHK